MKRVAVINIVGLCESLIGDETPFIRKVLQSGRLAYIEPAFPAVTCVAQCNYLTGKLPNSHGIVANGWYDRELAEVMFWKQSNHLVNGEKVWEELRKIYPGFTVAKLFWWFNMYSSADYSITPRPIYPADGRKLPDIYSYPYSIREQIKKELGEFPFSAFWGPFAGVDSPMAKADAASVWIAESAKWIEQKFQPSLSLVYLPHLDYNLQRYGNNRVKISKDLNMIDSIVKGLVEFYKGRSVRVLLLSEYGITDVSRAVHLNRIFRQRGWITIKEELGLERLDCGASKVFAVADHQVAHIYVNDKSLLNQARDLLLNTEGVEKVFVQEDIVRIGLNHKRSGDLIAMARSDSWFTYYYWADDKKAPDFARTVDIHRKPGYDPVELFLEPTNPFIKLKIALRLLQKRLGFRTLLDIIPLDATLVKGSHGSLAIDKQFYPVLISQESSLVDTPLIQSTDVYNVIKRAVMD